METEKACARCGSSKVVPRAAVLDRGDAAMDAGNVRLGIARKPSAVLFKGMERVDVYARVCGDCGYVELFVDEAQKIYRAYEDSRRSRE